MMCLNSNVVVGTNLKALLSHEFAHAVAFSARLRSNRSGYVLPDEDDWLNEAIAHLAENLHNSGWSNLDHRVRDYLNSPQSYPLVVPDYYSAGLWRNHGCRGATYLFLRWCVDQFGQKILAEMIHSPATGRDNIARVTGLSFAELYRRWAIAVASDDYQSLSLHRPLGRHSLRGPRSVDWNVAGGEKTLKLRGTSTVYLRLHAADSAAICRIRAIASADARLQVTVIKSNRVPQSFDRIAVRSAEQRLQ